MADKKISVSTDMLEILVSMTPYVFDPNSGQSLGQWNFTDPVEIEVNPYPFDPNYETVVFTENGKDPVTVLVASSDIEKIAEIVADHSPKIDLDDVIIDGGTHGIRGIGLSVTVYEDGQPQSTFLGGGYSLAGDISVSPSDQSGLVTLSVTTPEGDVNEYVMSPEDVQAVVEYRVGEADAAPLVQEMQGFDEPEQSKCGSDYGELRARCGAGAFTWDEGALIPKTDVPTSINPPDSFLREDFTSIAGTYNQFDTIAALVIDPTAPQIVETPSPVEADIQITMNTSFNPSSSFA